MAAFARVGTRVPPTRANGHARGSALNGGEGEAGGCRLVETRAVASAGLQPNADDAKPRIQNFFELPKRRDADMKEGIHPVYPGARVTCACGNVFVTRSTRGDFAVDVCSNCHPFYTGKQKLMDTQGRVDRFRRKYEKTLPASK